MKKVTAAIIGIIVIAFGALLVISLKNKSDNAVDYTKYDANAIIEGDQYNGNISDHVKGNKDAPVLLFEYADYQCPGCASINPRINKVLEEFGDKVGLVYRNYLLSYHQNGTAAATAAEAAAMQGYWKPYADMLFSNQSTWETASVEERGEMFVDLFAKVTEGKGDLDRFRQDMEKPEIKKKLSFDQGLGDKIGISGTPSIYLNGEKIDFSSAKTEEEFLALMRKKVNAALESKQKASGSDATSSATSNTAPDATSNNSTTNSATSSNNSEGAE
ncbi:thioredoxin domain-containing protein [Candidatus Saccharibacteria bacterium]|nr:thioredoxin domain-containing protein [Candidatus Saccharibacteria bacterium]